MLAANANSIVLSPHLRTLCNPTSVGQVLTSSTKESKVQRPLTPFALTVIGLLETEPKRRPSSTRLLGEKPCFFSKRISSLKNKVTAPGGRIPDGAFMTAGTPTWVWVTCHLRIQVIAVPISNKCRILFTKPGTA
ncbi:hypothetical protein SAMN04515648_2528 [Phyllobacterium sp. CL33Tsu]|nr:hypothetical protein SAMN04515648_2528 [Phyllobacterium sp. CL33Tsu]